MLTDIIIFIKSKNLFIFNDIFLKIKQLSICDELLYI